MHIFLEKSEKFFSFMDCENRNLNLHEKTFFENEKYRKSIFIWGYPVQIRRARLEYGVSSARSPCFFRWVNDAQQLNYHDQQQKSAGLHGGRMRERVSQVDSGTAPTG